MHVMLRFRMCRTDYVTCVHACACIYHAYARDTRVNVWKACRIRDVIIYLVMIIMNLLHSTVVIF